MDEPFFLRIVENRGAVAAAESSSGEQLPFLLHFGDKDLDSQDFTPCPPAAPDICPVVARTCACLTVRWHRHIFSYWQPWRCRTGV